MVLHKLTSEEKLSLQFILGVFVVLAGLTLLFLGFFAVPLGEIAPSVLTAFGEVGTFSGALIGVDYKYKFDRYKIDENYRHKRDMMDRHFAEANKHIDEIEEEYDITDTDRRD